MWNFKGTLWNSTHNILPIHWKIWFLYNIKILRALKFKSSYSFLKRPPVPQCPEHFVVSRGPSLDISTERCITFPCNYSLYWLVTTVDVSRQKYQCPLAVYIPCACPKERCCRPDYFPRVVNNTVLLVITSHFLWGLLTQKSWELKPNVCMCSNILG